MASTSASYSVGIVAEIAAPLVTQNEPSPITQQLTQIDHVITFAGLAILAVVFLLWTIRSRRDPLAHAPPRPNTIAEDAVLIAMAVYFTASLVFASLVPATLDNGEANPLAISAGIVGHLAGIVAILVISHQRFREGVWRFVFGPRQSYSRMLVMTMLTLLCAFSLCPIVHDVTLYMVNRFAPDFVLEAHPSLNALGSDEASTFAIVVIWSGAALVAPIAEEFFFRGLLQTLCINLFNSKWVAIFGTSAIFAGFHFSQPHAIPALLVLSIVLGYAYEKSGSLLPPIAIHVLFNLKTLIWHTLSTSAATS